MFTNSLRLRRNGCAFSLIELLAVIAIVGLLMVVAALSLGSVSDSGRVNGASAKMAGLLEQARMQAAAKNTYVWFCLREDTDASSPAVEAILVSSLDATGEGAAWDDPTPVNPETNSVLRLETRIERAEGVALIPDAQLAGVAATLGSPDGGSLAKTGPIFRISRGSNTRDFSRVIRFSPLGAARSGTQPARSYLFGMQGVKDKDRSNPVVISVEGQTGRTRVFRNH